jgi:hypothetical protein
MSIASLYPSINPSLLLDFANSKVLDPRITFTRTTTATYYDGVTTAVAEQNLLTYSQTTTGSTSSGLASTTADAATAPDGTTTAVSITISTGNSRHYLNTTRAGELTPPAGTTYTGSGYIKKNTADYVSVLMSNNAVGGGARYGITVNLTNGAVGGFSPSTGATGTSYTVTSVGNGWYRVTLTMTTSAVGPGGGANMNFTPMPTNGSTYSDVDSYPSWTGDGTSSIYIWGWQLEQRSSATAYTATTSQAITNYIPVLQTAAAGQARFDHNPTTGESLGLLIEEARTNLLLNSAAFGSWSATNGNPTINSNVIVAPDGTVSGDKFIPGTANGYQLVYQTAASSGTYTFSAYAKAGEYNQLMLWTDSPTTFGTSVFNLTNGTIVQTGTGHTNLIITSVGNGWYRCSITAATTSATPTFYMGIAPNGNTGGTFAGDGFSGGFLWGAQLEAGSFATSYIPTVASTVTRAQDLASMSGANLSSWFNNAQGTLYIDGARFGTNLYPRFACFYGQNTESYSIGIGQWASSSVTFYGVNSATQFSISQSPSGLTWGSQIRAAGAYAVNDVGFSANNTVTSVDTYATIPVIDIFYLGNGVNPAINGWLKKVAYYPIKATSTQLQALTV